MRPWPRRLRRRRRRGERLRRRASRVRVPAGQRGGTGCQHGVRCLRNDQRDRAQSGAVDRLEQYKVRIQNKSGCRLRFETTERLLQSIYKLAPKYRVLRDVCEETLH
eukprot:6173566-Pleurochrysis_carterae.AAC.1